MSHSVPSHPQMDVQVERKFVPKQKDLGADVTWAKINKDVLKSLEKPRPVFWVIFFSALALFSFGVYCEVYQYQNGMGVSDLNNPQVWGLYIATFIFWIGMGHSGTLLSALLHIIHADWRKPIYRYSEAMTTFTLLTAALFVLVHMGRLWQFYYVVAYPNERWTWPNFTSPLVWDATAIGTYLTSSLLFLYMGMIPDLAICRDNARGARRALYRFLSMGWQGTDRQWANFKVAYMTMACFLMPLAVSVHSIVSTDFAVSQNPGWHVTSFPPYFVLGALYSGCSGIITLFIVLRYVFRFEAYMTQPILNKLIKMTFAIAMVWTYLDLIEYATTWYGSDEVAKADLVYRATGDYALQFWGMIFCAMVMPFTLLIRFVRTNYTTLLIISLILNVGMWLERFQIITPTFAKSHYPWLWTAGWWPSWVQWGIVAGSFGWFTMLFMLYCKIFPSVSMYEVKEMVHEQNMEEKAHATQAEVHEAGLLPEMEGGQA